MYRYAFSLLSFQMVIHGRTHEPIWSRVRYVACCFTFPLSCSMKKRTNDRSNMVALI
jgi:hypothetical protein